MRRFLIALSMTLAAGVATPAFAQGATTCDLDAVAASKEELARLTALQRLNPSAVASGALANASQHYVQRAEACFDQLYGQSSEIIDEGGLFLTAPDYGAFVLFGTKWGSGSPYSGYGADNTGPRRPGGIVTYSYMADGISMSAESGVSNSVAVNSLPTYQACFQTEIANAFAAWSAVTNIQFERVDDNGAAFNAANAAGDIRIAAHSMDGASNVLAHGYYPPPNGNSAAGDMHFDAAENWSCTPGSGGVDIGIVALHELGHVLGLGHEVRSQRRAVMNPFYNPSVANVLLGDDVDGAVNIYGSATGATDDLVIGFRAGGGLWRYDYADAWSPIHGLAPHKVVVANLDGNGVDDLIANFGAAAGGVWIYQNNTSWYQLHDQGPTQMAVGDLDGNGLDEVILVFQGAGLYVLFNGSSWTHLHSLEPNLLAIANIDGILGADLIANFRGQGVWTFRNNSSWSQLHVGDASLIATGRLDTAARFPVEPGSGSRGLDDVLLAFPGYGLYQYSNNATWTHIHALSPLRVAVGDFDLDGRDDLTMDFGPGYGLWTLTNGIVWAPLHPSSSSAVVMGDLDGNGQDEIVVDFGAAGTWLRVNTHSWLQLSAAGQVDFNVVDFH